jgi:hypothetical protein
VLFSKGFLYELKTITQDLNYGYADMRNSFSVLFIIVCSLSLTLVSLLKIQFFLINSVNSHFSPPLLIAYPYVYCQTRKCHQNDQLLHHQHTTQNWRINYILTTLSRMFKCTLKKYGKHFSDKNINHCYYYY